MIYLPSPEEKLNEMNKCRLLAQKNPLKYSFQYIGPNFPWSSIVHWFPLISPSFSRLQQTLPQRISAQRLLYSIKVAFVQNAKMEYLLKIAVTQSKVNC